VHSSFASPERRSAANEHKQHGQGSFVLHASPGAGTNQIDVVPKHLPVLQRIRQQTALVAFAWKDLFSPLLDTPRSVNNPLSRRLLIQGTCKRRERSFSAELRWQTASEADVMRNPYRMSSTSVSSPHNVVHGLPIMSSSSYSACESVVKI
jgi:hypothetical protein